MTTKAIVGIVIGLIGAFVVAHAGAPLWAAVAVFHLSFTTVFWSNLK